MISVIVIALNAEKFIARCLDGLRAQKNLRDELEIILVDDGSTDSTAEIAKARGARVLSQTNQGMGASRNNGSQIARGDILLFLDSDLDPDPNWAVAMAAPFADPNVVGVGGTKQTRQTNWVARFVQMEFDYRYDRVRAQKYIDFVDGGTCGYRREIFLQNGGFDTRLSDAEDAEFSFRMSERGYKMAFAGDAKAYHEHPTSLWAYLERKFTYAYWRSFVYKAHPGKIAKDSRTPQTQKIQTALALLFPFTILAAIFWSPACWVVTLIAAILFFTNLKFVARFWSRDWKLALAAPVLITLSAFATGLGIAAGGLSRAPVKKK